MEKGFITKVEGGKQAKMLIDDWAAKNDPNVYNIAVLLVARLGVMMLFVMVSIIGVSTMIMGSGNASFLTFANLVPDISAKLAIYPPLLLVPMELTSSIARSVSPITAVIVIVSGIAQVSPIDLVKRTAIPMLGVFFVNILATVLLFYR